MDEHFHTIIKVLKDFLDRLPEDKMFIIFHPIRLGKMIKGIPVNSKETLTGREARIYHIQLKNIFSYWHKYGHDEWEVEQMTPSGKFTVKFIRKE